MPKYIDVVEVIYEGDKMKAVPAADIEEIRHGRWSKQRLVDDGFGGAHIGYFCSVCQNFIPNKGNYCLECGAKMDGKINNN